MRNTVIFVIYALLIVLVTYLLVNKHIEAGSYTLLFSILSISAIAIFLSDRLKELDIKNLKLVLTDIRKVKKDIYAKEESLRLIGEEIAELTTVGLTLGWNPKRGQNINLRNSTLLMERSRLHARDRIANILKEIGSSEETRRKITSRINEQVLNNLKKKLYDEMTSKLLPGWVVDGEVDEDAAMARKIYDLLFSEPYNRQMLETYLKETKNKIGEDYRVLWRDSFSHMLNIIDQYIETNEL